MNHVELNHNEQSLIDGLGIIVFLFSMSKSVVMIYCHSNVSLFGSY